MTRWTRSGAIALVASVLVLGVLKVAWQASKSDCVQAAERMCSSSAGMDGYADYDECVGGWALLCEGRKGGDG